MVMFHLKCFNLEVCYIPPLILLHVNKESFTETTITWLTVTNICITNDHVYVPCVVSTSRAWCNTTDTTSSAGTAFPSGAPEFTPVLRWDSC